ncbi:MAG: hypothetical protein M3Z75_03800 [Actinomycetota bacterium]|nr:hypothetical protein [Actinomycetota bacterium]
MRFDLLARRIMAPALGVALAVTVAACSSSSSTSAATSPSSPAASSAPSSPAATGSSSAPASSGAGSSAAVAQITANWEAFFSGKTSAAKKISLLENGSTFASVVSAQAGSGLASSVTAKVTAVVVNSSTSATVSYNLISNSQTLLSNQTGKAVDQGGTWKVGDVSFCSLLKLEDSTASVCSSSG